jgi:hypothetical protein
MNSKHRQTLKAIFSDPVSASIAWADVESLFRGCGAHVREGNGSRIRVTLNDARATFHRPHPQKETDRGAVKFVRLFLKEARITP